MREKKKSFELRTTQVIALGFVILILTGSVLLSLPFASADGRATPYIDALFTATTSSCVTGLVTVVTGQHWSLFGQAVILVMIQLGWPGGGFLHHAAVDDRREAHPVKTANVDSGGLWF